MGIRLRHIVAVSALLGVGAFVYVVGFEKLDEEDHPRAGAISMIPSQQSLISQIRRHIAGGKLENADRVTNLLYKHYGRGASSQPDAFFWRATVDDLLGNNEDARTNWGNLRAMLDDPGGWNDSYSSDRKLYLRAWAMHGLGEVEVARELFGTVADRLWIASEPRNGRAQRTSIDLYNMACYRSMSNRLPEALAHWEQAVVNGYGQSLQDDGWWKMDPDLKPLHALTRFWEVGRLIGDSVGQVPDMPDGDSGGEGG